MGIYSISFKVLKKAAVARVGRFEISFLSLVPGSRIVGIDTRLVDYVMI